MMAYHHFPHWRFGVSRTLFKTNPQDPAGIFPWAERQDLETDGWLRMNFTWFTWFPPVFHKFQNFIHNYFPDFSSWLDFPIFSTFFWPINHYFQLAWDLISPYFQFSLKALPTFPGHQCDHPNDVHRVAAPCWVIFDDCFGGDSTQKYGRWHCIIL